MITPIQHKGGIVGIGPGLKKTIGCLFIFFLISLQLLNQLNAEPVHGGSSSAQTSTIIRGFTPARSAIQKVFEQKLKAIPTSRDYRAHLKALTLEPHVAGTHGSKKVADYILKVMQDAGVSAEKIPYDVYLPYPEDIRVALVRPVRKPLNTKEYILEEDGFSAHPELWGGWNAYSADGDITSSVVYVNYGRKEDFEKLAELDVKLSGKIVLARYGKGFRGYKAKFAEAAGAVGLILYSDPADYGFVKGEEYPKGRYLPSHGIQRGSIKTLPYPGDPLTPFEAAIPGVKRLDPQKIDLPGIPVTPIPYNSAREILSRLEGEVVPKGWQGGLPFTYHLGGSETVSVRLKVKHERALRKINNVVGILKGSEFPDEWIILGSHYDAWAFGAVDPNSGTAMILEVAKAFGQLAREGLRPRRTLIFAHWDAEEFGIIGSTEWVEQFSRELREKAVVYINADGVVFGPKLYVKSAPLLKKLFIEVTKAVQYPGGEQTVLEHWIAQDAHKKDAEKKEVYARIKNLGGGSDHLGFYCFLGIPAGYMGLASPAPIYHSAYDNFSWFSRFGDHEFIYGPTLARLNVVLLARFANADIIPMDPHAYAIDLEGHIKELEKRSDELKFSDVDFENLNKAISGLNKISKEFEGLCTKKLVSGIEAAELKKINQALRYLERIWILPAGLQGRAWYRNLYVSPDPFSGYASWMLPGLRYEIEQRDPAGFKRWEKIYLTVIEKLRMSIKDMTQLIN